MAICSQGYGYRCGYGQDMTLYMGEVCTEMWVGLLEDLLQPLDVAYKILLTRICLSRPTSHLLQMMGKLLTSSVAVTCMPLTLTCSERAPGIQRGVKRMPFSPTGAIWQIQHPDAATITNITPLKCTYPSHTVLVSCQRCSWL